MAGEENKALLQRAVERWNQRDLNGYLELYDPNCTIYGPPGVSPGIEAIRQFYSGFWSAFHNSRLEIEDALAEDDKVAARFSVSGAHKGEFQGIPPTDKQVTIGGITILRFRDGKCIERWNQADFLGLVQQLTAS